MAEILPGVHIVQAAPGLATPGGGMNICLLIEGGTITMVDAGLPGSSTGLLAYLDEIGLAPGAIRRVIVTHHHVDHVGGLPEMLERSGAEVWAHRDDAAVIEGVTPRPGIPPERAEAMLAAMPAEQRAAAAARMKQMSESPQRPSTCVWSAVKSSTCSAACRSCTARVTRPGTCVSTCRHCRC